MKSNRRFILNPFVIVAIAASFCACDDTVNIGGFDVLCAQSGGTYKDGKCYCKSQDAEDGKTEACPDGVICNVESKTCASDGVTASVDDSCTEEEKDHTICIDVEYGDDKVRNGMYRTCLEIKDGASKKYKWGELTPCSADPKRRVLCDGNKCSECEVDTFKCEDDARQQCIGGKWIKKETCTYGCADNYICASKCDVSKCVNDENNKLVGTMTECTNDRASVYMCKKKETSEPVSCNAAGSGCGICLNGSTECKDGKTMKCINGNLDEPSVCPNNFSCKSASECGECQNGKNQKCKDSQLTVCSSGKWTAEPCPDEASCKSETECGDCKEGAKICEDGKVRECQNGVWIGPKVCDSNASCKSGTECGECKNSEKKCETKAGVHYLTECVNGAWSANTSPCPDGLYCASSVAVDRCVSCTRGKCNKGAYIPCVAGAWGTPEDCQKESKVCFAAESKQGCYTE